jgi:putative membrane protein
MRLIIRIIINMFGLWLAAYIVPRMSLADDSWITLLILAIVFGLINAFIRPIIRILTFPITFLTLGLFTFIVNALMLMIAGMTPWLTFEGGFFQMFMAALFGSVIISIVSTIANWFLPDKN